MELREFPVCLDSDDLPTWVVERIESGTDAVERFRVLSHRSPVTEFHPSNFEMAYRLVHRVLSHHHPTPGSFCEWGSGIPLVASLADGLGLSATAIEIDDHLHAAATAWLATFENSVRLRHGSFLSVSDRDLWQHFPPHGGILSPNGDKTDWSCESAADIVYAYPWPGEDALIQELFLRRARPGLVLITFHGSDHFRVRQACRSRRPAGH